MIQANTSELSALWQAHQSQDMNASLAALVAAGCSEETTKVAYNAISRMASEARDFNHFAQMFGGEAPMKTKLTVSEAVSLQMATESARRGSTWQGNGGRTWEGSSR